MLSWNTCLLATWFVFMSVFSTAAIPALVWLLA